ncbi:MAG: PmoA family protein [Candidatus Latescibacteria bacterium]|jgi:hypothetical protein|nr:PmoA family protein [Candidatus Latescibacterota bacterium]
MATVKLTVNAGPHNRINCPVSIVVDAPKSVSTAVLSLGKKEVACQVKKVRGGLQVDFIVANLGAGKIAEYKLVTGKKAKEGSRGVEVAKGRNEVSVSVRGRHFTTYCHDKNFARPRLYPVIGPYGDPVTRRLAVPEDGRELDHHHHRSIWIAHGEVNGADNWSEGGSHGRILHRRFESLESGPVLGRIVSRSDWVGMDGWTGPPGKKREILDQRSEWIVYNTSPSVRIMDLHLTLTAQNTDVLFGDTKEGGLASIRVEETMEVKRGFGGKIENGIGGIDEDETWGKRAPWCHYSGPVNGNTTGIAIMDHPDSFRHPTHWHVRNYGLMTANPFGHSYFYKDENRRGHYTLPQGESIVGIYRYYFHKGDATEGNIRERYHDFAHPPKVTVG